MNFWCDMVFEVKTWEGLKQSKETTCNTPYYISLPRLKQCKETNVIFKWFITNENYRSANNRFCVKFGLVVWSYRVKRVSPSTKKCQPLIESYRFVLDSKWSPIKKNFCAVLGILGVFHENKRKPEGFGIKRDNKIQKLSHSKNQNALPEYRHCFKQQLTKHRIIEILKRSKLHAA